MQILVDAGILLASYLIGSIPFGLILVKLLSGKDIRMVESGRTGGTNALRAAGWVAGLLTGILDVLKAAAAVWLSQVITANEWIHALAPIAAILGHNYSLFLAERDERGGWRLRGGAGGAPSFGGALGLWAPSALIILPIAALIYYFIGYASVTTLSVALMATLIFAVRAMFFHSPWEYVIYGVLSGILLFWALLPNIKRLMNGTERLHGWRAKRQPKKPVNGSDRD
ncbi:MAG: glycerol-3-phosphate acyltransferase [Anaerolineales bacterium]|nr:glycerol-3-phosphate acyltransferase [Anaerolineales bacterium]